ncbi:GATA zinc finger domain-containing protein 14-like [Vespula squamosa]|uniref:GATA zinc finger domain-containing protein 14-like n=1 Tax=Vespula squamosa TaxID=30214 RepID=A0ABD2A705_VESSQ
MISMIELIQLLVITSVLQEIVVGDLSKIDDVQTCMEFCSTSGNVGNFKDGYCVCENLDNTDAENVVRENRQTEYVDPISYPNDLTNEDRTMRCALRSRKHMRHHDADRVVTYFINDGPANGHAYFVQAANQNINTERECRINKYPSTNSYRNADEPNNQVPTEQSSMTENYSKRSYNDAIVGAPYNPYNPVYFLPHKVSIASVAPVVMNPYVMGATYGTVIGPRNNMLSHPTDTVHGTLRDNLVGAKLLPKIRSRSNLLRRVSNALVGIVKEPEKESVLGTFLNNIITQDPTAYSSEYNNNKSVIDKNNVGSEIKQVNSIVSSTNETGQTPTENSEIAPQENIQMSSETRRPTNSMPSIQRTNISPKSFQSIPYNQHFMSMYSSQQYPIGDSFNNMPTAYILQPVNIISQGRDSTPQSEIISSSQSRESLDCENNSSLSTSEPSNTFQISTDSSNN